MKTLIAAITTVALSLVVAPAALAQSSGLVAAYGFEEATGTVVTDSAGGLNPGTISGATRSASGRFGSALSFDGVNDRVNVNDSASLDLSTAMTLEAWVRPDATNWRTTIMKERPGGIAYALYESTDSNRPSVEIHTELRGTSAVPTGTWSHLASTYDGATLRLYVNGTQVASRAATGPINISSGALRIGGNAVWGEWFKGLIDEVRVYNRSLTASEIQTDMNRAVAGDTQAPTNPVLTGAATGDDVHLSWTASSDNVGVAEYRVYRDGVPIATLSPTTLAYDDLDRPAGTYRYWVRPFDAAGNSGRSSDVPVIVPPPGPDTTPPNVTVNALGAPATDNFCATTPVHDYVPLRVSWGDNRGPVTMHIEVDGATVKGPFTDAVGGETYWDFETAYIPNGQHTTKVIARDGAGNETVRECTWTVQNPDYEVPITAPEDGATVRGVVTITTAPTSNGNPISYGVALSGAPGATQTGVHEWSWDTTAVPDGGYTLKADLLVPSYEPPLFPARATDTIHVTVDNSVPPPTGLTAAVQPNGHDVDVHWNRVDGISSYNVYRDGVKLGNTSANSADDPEVPSGTHTYTVKAVVGPNESPASNAASVTINRPPAAPVLSGTAADHAAHLSWTAASDDLGLREYRVYRNDTLLATKSASTFTLDDPGLADGTYRYRVTAVDDGGLTASSNEVTLDVTSDTTAPVLTVQAICDGRNLDEYIGPIRANATDDSGGPVTVNVDVDDKHIYGPQPVNGDFQFYWDTRAHANGPVLMKITARDAAGNETVKDCPWTVNNRVLSVPITAPADGATVTGSVNVAFQTLANGLSTNAPVRLYIDGTKVSDGFTYSYAWDTTKVANGPHTIRADMFWQGYTQVMATSTIQVQVQNAPTGLVAAYGFEETGGTAVTDSSGKGMAGTISGAMSVTGGKFGRALSFDGVNDLVTVPDANPLDLTPGMTLEAWVKPATVSDWRTVLLKERPGQLAYALYAASDNGRPMTEIAAAAQREARGPSALPAGSWSHVAATYDGTTLKLYVNGTQVATGTTSGSLFNSTGALRIGGNTIWGEWFSGLIDEVRVYERALTAAEIAADRDRPVLAGS
jgi:concanavalin A-like lectin/glucanase superfamily protein/Big-like domain-containing protein